MKEPKKPDLIDRIRTEVVNSDISPSDLRIVMDILRQVEKEDSETSHIEVSA